MHVGYIALGPGQVALAAVVLLLNLGVSLLLQLGLVRTLLWAGFRMVLQLSLIGLVLEWIFAHQAPLWLLGLASLMTLMAGRTAVSRTRQRYQGIYLNAFLAMISSTWIMTSLAMTAIIRPQPWYQAQYLIPLLGMLLGNGLNGISLGLERFLETLRRDQERIDSLLALGASRAEAVREALQISVRAGLLPITNTMLVAGIVSLPGMMTGQILSGVSPLEAVKYQIVIMFLIAGNTALGTVLAVWLSYRRLFNSWHQFRAEKLWRV